MSPEVGSEECVASITDIGKFFFLSLGGVGEVVVLFRENGILTQAGKMMDVTPLFQTPFMDIGGCLINFQQQKRCADFELRFVECMEAYGIPLGYKKCSDIFEDFHECATRNKQRQRIAYMITERDRQHKAGILKEKYSTSPKEDSY